MKNEFKYEIVKHLATLSHQETSRGNTFTKELNLISFNGDHPRYDLCNWKRTEDGTVTMMKGITMTEFEMVPLIEALNREYPSISAALKRMSNENG